MAEPEPEPIPWLRKADLAYYGPFRDNVRAFIKSEMVPDEYHVEGGVLGYSVALFADGAGPGAALGVGAGDRGTGAAFTARLRVYEETMLDSTRVHCDCCRCIGWHHHPVTRKQYHFIIHSDFRTDLKPELQGKRICQLCTAALPEKEKVCTACGENDSQTSILDYQTHLMHGMLHANGCGHLKRINGREAGSRMLSGQQLIQIWEKICNLLRAREVSVEDVSQKYGVEFRLLNPVACGQTWYGTYGYAFGKGSFGNTAASHRNAAERLRGFPLEAVKADFIAMAASTSATAGAGAGVGAVAAVEGGLVARAAGGNRTSGGGRTSETGRSAATAVTGPRGADAAGAAAAGGAAGRAAARKQSGDEVLMAIARYEGLMGPTHAPKTMGALVLMLLRLQRIVRRNDKAARLEELRVQRREGRTGDGVVGGSGGGEKGEVENGFGAGHWAEADAAAEVEAEVEAGGCGPGNQTLRRRQEEHNAAAKRKASVASCAFEPLTLVTKRLPKVTKETGDEGNRAGAETAAGAPCANKAESKVMSAARPRAVPTRPLRPRGADGLVPPSAPVKEESSPGAPSPKDGHHNSGLGPSPGPSPGLSPCISPPLAKKQKKADKEKQTHSNGNGHGNGSGNGNGNDNGNGNSNGKAEFSGTTAVRNPTTIAGAGGGEGGEGHIQSSPAALPSAGTPGASASAPPWSDARIETAANTCAEVLREAGGTWVPRREVRVRARAKGVGDTGLVDYALKNIIEQKVLLTVLTKAEGKQNKSHVKTKTKIKTETKTKTKTKTELKTKTKPKSNSTPDTGVTKNAQPPKGVASSSSIRAYVKQRTNVSTGQLEYQLESVAGMARMRASVVVSVTATNPTKASAAQAGAAGAAPGAGSGVGSAWERVGAEAAGAVVPGGETGRSAATEAEAREVGLTGEQAAMEEAARQLCKDDLDRDVKVVYKNLLESYKPARPRPSRSARGVVGGVTSPTAKCRGADLIDAARVLLDTKQFVKTYLPVEDLLALRPPPPLGPGGGGKGGRPPMLATGVRVLVTAVIDARNRGPKVSGMADKAAKKHKHGIETKPPPEVVLLPPDPLLSDLKAAASKAFQELYVVLAKYKVKTVVGFEGVADKTRLGVLGVGSNSKKAAGLAVEVHGDGADLESEFRYQGGLDQWVVRCVCGTCDDDGERMIACDACGVWMHTRCVGISDAQGTPRRWTCVECEVEVREAAEAAAAVAPPPGRPPPMVRCPLPEKNHKKRKESRR